MGKGAPVPRRLESKLNLETACVDGRILLAPEEAAEGVPAGGLLRRSLKGSSSDDDAGDATSEKDCKNETVTCTHAEWEAQLRAHLLKGYDILAIPKPANGTLEVKMELAIYKLMGLDLSSSDLVLNVWMRQTWLDYRLSWQPSEWNNIQSLPFFAIKGKED